jgi:putative PIN family toxin of toxin-antitoxin system
MIAGRTGVVFDCNVLLQAALRADGPAAECLRQLDANRITVYVSRATIKELRAVFDYPAIRERNPDLTDAHVEAFIERLLFKGVLVRRVRHAIDYPRAKQDEPYIDLAATAKADYLVSRDKDLLDLMTGHSAVCKEFRQKTHPLKVLDPVAFLQVIGQPWKPAR